MAAAQLVNRLAGNAPALIHSKGTGLYLLQGLLELRPFEPGCDAVLRDVACCLAAHLRGALRCTSSAVPAAYMEPAASMYRAL